MGFSFCLLASFAQLLIAFADGLRVALSVRIEELFPTFLPRRFEFRRCDVPVWPTFLENGTQILAEIFQSGSTEEPVAHVNLINDKTGLEHDDMRNHRIVHGV